MAKVRAATGGEPNGNLVIESLGVYLPPTVLTTAEVVRGCRKPLEFPLEQLTGIAARRVAGETESSLDLARKAAEDCLARSRYGPSDVDLLISCSISRHGPNGRFAYEPSQSLELKRQLGLERATGFDLANACAGMFTALYVVDAFLRSGTIRRALVVSGEYITHLIRTAQLEIDGLLDPRLACLTLGDGAAALLLERGAEPGVGLQDLELYTLGRYASYCIARATDREHGGFTMLTDSLRLGALAAQHAVRHAAHVQRRDGRPLDAFDRVIVHQTSRTSIQEAMRQINRLVGRELCHPGNMLSNLAERGNTASTSHVVALADGVRGGHVRAGDRIVFSITASGATVGTALYTLDDLPDRLRNGPTAPPRSAATAHRGAGERGRPRPTVTARIESLGTLSEREPGGATALELARAAAERCLAASLHARDEIEILIYSGLYRDEFQAEPAMAALLAGALGMNDSVEPEQPNKTLAFDVLNGGIGCLNACYVALQLIRAGKCARAMIAAAEVENNPPGAAEPRRGLVESGSALVLERSALGQGFGTILFRSFTGYAGALRAHAEHTGSRMVLRIARDPRLEAYYLECIAATVGELLDHEGLDLARVRAILPPQLSSEFGARLSDRLGVERRRVVDLGGEGDYFTSSLACSFERAHALGLAAEGDVGLLIEVGSGLQVGCATYYF